MLKPDEHTGHSLRVLLADDHRMIVEMFSMFLGSIGGMEVVTATCFDTAAERMQAEGPFDVVLLDFNMPGMNGIEGLNRAIEMNGGRPVAIITGSMTQRQLEEVMACGAAGIVLKTTPLRSLANAIRFMDAGERYLPMELVRAQAEGGRTTRTGPLSPKEMTVLERLAEGKQNREIASELSLAEPTVKMHVTAICRKLGAQNRTHAVVMARDMGLV